MNNVNLIGRLTRDPELRKMGDSDRDVSDLRIAVDNGPGRDATYVDVSTFDAQARAVAKHLAKGRQVGVTGRLVYREWQAEDGGKRSRHSVIGRVEFLGSRNGAPSSAESADDSGSDDDIPF